MNTRDLLDLIALRDAEDSMTRAIGWTVSIYHTETPDTYTLYGHFTDPAPALCWADDFEKGLNIDGETGFRAVPMPVLPAEPV